jgi:hypothetical protein
VIQSGVCPKTAATHVTVEAFGSPSALALVEVKTDGRGLAACTLFPTGGDGAARFSSRAVVTVKGTLQVVAAGGGCRRGIFALTKGVHLKVGVGVAPAIGVVASERQALVVKGKMEGLHTFKGVSAVDRVKEVVVGCQGNLELRAYPGRCELDQNLPVNLEGLH